VIQEDVVTITRMGIQGILERGHDQDADGLSGLALGQADAVTIVL
jgi:hypothetical protein